MDGENEVDGGVSEGKEAKQVGRHVSDRLVGVWWIGRRVGRYALAGKC